MKSQKKSPRNDLAPSPIGVKEIAIEDLYANPHNPRILFDKEPLRVLRESIAKVGILVPLTVYREKKSGRFIILDGQRRWMVAQDIGLRTVPVNEVAEPSLVQNIVTMFQIHKLREDWELMPTALKLEILMVQLEERNEKKLAALTGLDQAVVTRCKKLLDFPRQYQALMLDPEPTVRIKADFFIELYAVRNDRFVNSLNWFERSEFTEKMLDRYQKRKGIKAVTDFRTIKQHITNARKAGKDREIGERLRAFVNNPELGIEHLAVRAANVGAQARKLEAEVVGLRKVLGDMDVGSFYGEESLWKELEELLRLIVRRLGEAGRRVRK
jgi:ParB family transcriptional regulator, chromosome partitioning protein